MKPTENMDTLEALTAAKSEQNIQQALEIYAPDIDLISPSFDSRVQGTVAVGRHLDLFFAMLPDYAVQVERVAGDDDWLLASGRVQMTLTLPGLKCPRVELPVFMEFEFRENRICKEVFALDKALLCQKSAISPEALTKGTVALVHTLKKGKPDA